MEDFGSILWTVVLIGFAIFSVAAKGRKKGDEHRHDEAWPSWGTDSDTENAQEPRDTEEVSERIPERTSTYGSVEFPESYKTEAFPEEAQSLEEIPEQEYTSFEQTGTAISGTLNPHTATQTSSMLQGRNAFVDDQYHGSERNSQTYNPPKLQAEPAGISNNASLNEATEDLIADFDLRKAVIYSEMLKPKFDE